MDEKLKKDIENTRAQMRKGYLEYCIMLVISRGKMYANSLISELKKADLIVVEGTIYPLLSRLKNAGLLDYTWEESKSGPPRKYYVLTETGTTTIAELTKTWQQLDKTINNLLKRSK